MLGAQYRSWLWAGFALWALTAGASGRAAAGKQPTVGDLKARLASTSIGARPHLCVEIAQKQLEEADKQYAANEVEKAQSELTDVVAYAELARDYAIESHKHERQTEIAARGMTRRLTDLLHSLGRDDQAPVQDAIKHLEKVRDDLLKAMFPKGAK
ncbi:MAG: hypothetical protein ABSF93_19830 [Candidatus Sulfotelmatobacter sp.]|jgi:hypothetical protein